MKTTEPKRFSASDRTMIGFGVVALIVLMGLALKGEHKAPAAHSANAPTPASDPAAIAAAAALKAQMNQGEELYSACVMCHGPAGEGVDGQFPPLINAPLVVGPPSRLARVLINGLEGPIVVNGKTYDLPMQGGLVNEDTEIAAVMTFIRRSFGNRASAVMPEFVAKVRAEIGTRDTSWTSEELEKVP